MIESVELEARIISAWADAARAADVSRLLPEIEAAATAADVAAAEARSKALDPMLPRAEVVAVRRQSDDAGSFPAATHVALREKEYDASQASGVALRFQATDP